MSGLCPVFLCAVLLLAGRSWRRVTGVEAAVLVREVALGMKARHSGVATEKQPWPFTPGPDGATPSTVIVVIVGFL